MNFRVRMFVKSAVKGKNAMNNKMRYNKSTIRGKISIKKTKSNEVIIRLIKTDLNKYPPI